MPVSVVRAALAVVDEAEAAAVAVIEEAGWITMSTSYGISEKMQIFGTYSQL